SGWNGETLFYDDRGEIVLAVVPRPNRAVFFDSRISHVGRAPSRGCPALRVTVAYKLEATAWQELKQRTLLKHSGQSWDRIRLRPPRRGTVLERQHGHRRKPRDPPRGGQGPAVDSGGPCDGGPRGLPLGSRPRPMAAAMRVARANAGAGGLSRFEPA